MWVRIVGLVAAVGLFTTGASAQLAGDDACTQSHPCAIDLDVDDIGFILEADWNGTQGDWYVLTVMNWDIMPHTVALGDIELVAYPWDSDLVDDEGRAVSAPFEADVGFHVITDDVTRDTGSFDVLATETPTATFEGIGEEIGQAAADSVDVPSPGWLGVGSLVAVALLRRR